jgi:uncharacterized RDD family membrane protein YckC
MRIIRPRRDVGTVLRLRFGVAVIGAGYTDTIAVRATVVMKPQAGYAGDMATQELQYVGFWPRVGAALIDTLLLLVVCAPLVTWFYGWEYWSSESVIHGPADFLINWVLPAVAVVLFWVYRQATPGKIAISARIVDAETGAAPSTGQLIGRYLGYYVSILPLMAGIVWVAFDPRKQGWHDKLAGTVVVRRST